jgi:NTF2 fold immunity protein
MNQLAKNISVAVLLAVPCVWLPGAIGQEPAAHSVRPKAGLVPDDVTAIKIAEAVWLPIYGAAIYDKKPFTAKLKGNIWIVEGTLPQNTGWRTCRRELSH